MLSDIWLIRTVFGIVQAYPLATGSRNVSPFASVPLLDEMDQAWKIFSRL